MALSAEQIAQHAYAAGFRGHALTTAVAVAMAESHGNPDSHNGKPPDNSYGLWQINMLGAMGPERRKQFDIDSNRKLFDPDTNAKAAYDVSNHGKSFEPWSTYQDGAYKKYLDDARKAANQVSDGHGKGHGSGSGDGHKAGHGKEFGTNTTALRAYSKAADGIADELEKVGDRTVHSVSSMDANSFGPVGKETGFTDALVDFSTRLEKQVKMTGKNVRKLGTDATEAAKTYEETDETATKHLAKALV